MAPSPSRRSAGLHLDGSTATLVVLRDPRQHPVVDTVSQTTGFTAADALQRALVDLDPAIPVRVTFAASGTASRPVDLTPATLTRAGFESAARRAFGQLHHTAALAGVVADPDAVRAGQVQPGLAVAAPADLVDDLYRVLAGRPSAEVTTTTAGHGPLDGLHLALRRTTSELVLVASGVPVAGEILPGGGFDEVTAALGHDTGRAEVTAAGAAGDPLATAALRAWLSRVIAACLATLNEWAIGGHPVGTQLYVHGRGAAIALLDELLAEAGLRRLPHPLAGLPYPTPLDAVDAYNAAATCGTHLPLAVFHNARPVAAAGKTRTPRTRARTDRRRATLRVRHRRRRALTGLAAALAVAGIGAAGFAGYRHYAAVQDLDLARTEVAVSAQQGRNLEAAQLRAAAAALAGPSPRTLRAVLAATDGVPVEIAANGSALTLRVTAGPAAAARLLHDLRADPAVVVAAATDPTRTPFTLTVKERP